jgi:hypothetical protein
MTNATLDPKFFTSLDQSGINYPALQLDNYRPSSLETKLRLIISPESKELLEVEATKILKLIEIKVDFGEGEKEMHHITSPSTRFVILSMPKKFSYDKDEKKVYKQYEEGSGRVSIARILLAALVDDQLLLSGDGTPQIFTLKLTSTKTNLIADRSNKEAKTILALNTALQRHYKASKSWLTHLVSVDLQPYVYVATSAANKKDSSKTTGFKLVGDAVPLTPPQQADVFHLISSDDFKALAADPFGLDRNAQELSVVDELSHSADDIAF